MVQRSLHTAPRPPGGDHQVRGPAVDPPDWGCEAGVRPVGRRDPLGGVRLPQRGRHRGQVREPLHLPVRLHRWEGSARSRRRGPPVEPLSRIQDVGRSRPCLDASRCLRQRPVTAARRLGIGADLRRERTGLGAEIAHGAVAQLLRHLLAECIWELLRHLARSDVQSGDGRVLDLHQQLGIRPHVAPPRRELREGDHAALYHRPGDARGRWFPGGHRRSHLYQRADHGVRPRLHGFRATPRPRQLRGLSWHRQLVRPNAAACD
mmetsp:Transcript_35162/g.101249  ORF Transcript_35162/g.101249 Transcript_35162/m.101249 type:complete len:263 (+) Transcript_35162:1625-2413(+)